MANVRYVNHDLSGRILSWGSLDENYLPFLHLNVGELRAIGNGTSETHYVLLDTVVPRPIITAEQPVLAVDQDWNIPNIPSETRVVIAENLAGVTEDFGTLTLSFPTPGTWTVRLDPPWPWIGVDLIVEVTE